MSILGVGLIILGFTAHSTFYKTQQQSAAKTIKTAIKVRHK